MMTMCAPLPPSRALSTDGATGWDVVRLGESAATVYRSSDGRLHAKCAPPVAAPELARERDKLRWLASTGIPCPDVVDWEETRAGAVLVTSTLPGIPASDVPHDLVSRAVESLADLLRRMHDLRVQDCPWVRRLAVTVEAAARAVDATVVDFDDFDDGRHGRTARDVLAELFARRPAAEELEPAELVVCHGDPCLPNILLDAGTAACTGVLDIGRLGVSDRYLDLALITRSVAAPGLNPQYDVSDATRLLRLYGVPDPDEQRLDFYRLLDEFF